MKRYGNLFDVTFDINSLYKAFIKASKGKKKTLSYIKFASNLGYEIDKLHKEVLNGTYKPKEYRHLVINTPKKREILAPHFRDIIIQHAVYDTIYPIFNKSFIDTSYACRKGKGTHAASNKAFKYIQKHDSNSYTIHLDIKKYFPSINTRILLNLIKTKIKDDRLINIIKLFCGDKEIGIPLGNLLSQLFSLIYLNPVDHYIKRELKIKNYIRYVDDMMIIGIPSKKIAIDIKNKIYEFIKNNLNLEYSKYSIHKIKNGINFVGYRTWKTHRLIRKYSLKKFKKSLTKSKIDTLISIIAHSKTTKTLEYIKNQFSKHPEIYKILPKQTKKLIKI